MKSAKKLLAFIMAVIMLLSVMSVGMIAMASTVSVGSNTGSDSYETTDNVIICVPETIYLKPSDGESNTAQYFVNNKVDKTGNISVEAQADNARGEISIYAPEFTAFSISANAVTGGIGDPVIGSSNESLAESYEDKRWENTSFGEAGYIDFYNLCCFINGKGLKFGQTALIEWKVTLYYGDNDTVGKTYYAYTTLYSPIYNAVGASTEARYSKKIFTQNTSWIVGLTDISTIETSVGRSSMNRDKGSLITGSFVNEPLLGLSTNVVKSSVENLIDTINTDGANYVRGWQISDRNSTSARGSIGYFAVDSSRYTNMNQLPNFYIGSECNDAGKDAGTLKHLYSYYTVDGLNCYSESEYKNRPSGWTQWINLQESSGSYDSNVKCSVESSFETATKLREYVYNTNAVRFYYTPSIELSSITSEDYLHVMTQTKAKGGGYEEYANTYVSAQISITDKSDLRASVIQATSLDETKYTQNSWSGASATVVEEFQEALREAAEVLGDPSSTQGKIDSALSNFESKKSKLKVVIHFNAATNGGAFEDGNTYKDYSVTFGSKNSVTLGNSLLKYFKVLKKDYDFIGWTVYPDNDPLNATLNSIENVTYGDTLIAHFGKTIAVNFHYLEDIRGNTDVKENSFYIYDNENKAPNVKVEKPDDVSDYKFAGWTTDPKSTVGSELADELDGITESTEYYATYKKTVKIKLDANGGTFDIDSVSNGIGYNYNLTEKTGETTLITLPETTPSKAGSSFKGWDIDGVVYQAGDTVEIGENTTATAVWDIGVYKVTFVYKNENGTEMSIEENIEYGSAAVAPDLEEIPQCWYDSDKHYTFVKWDKAFDFISDDTVITAVYTEGENHNYSTEGKYPTCDEAGEVKFTCKDCGYSYVYSSGPLGHHYQITESKAATCTEDGYIIRTCTHDSTHKDTKILKATGHKYEGDGYVAPTCTEDGYYKSGSCSSCGADLTNVKIPALGHDFSFELEHKDATCNEDGYTLYKCSRCNETFTDVIPAHGCDWSVVVTPATCEKDGEAVYTCTYDSSHTYKVKLTALGHNWITVVIAPTCTSKGYTIVSCSNCGESTKKDYVDAKGHDYTSVVVEPTCTEKGYTKYTCSSCGHSYKKDYVDALGHDYSETEVVAPTCTNRGYTLYKCSHCDSFYKSDYVAALGHKYDLINTVQPTLTQSGYKQYKCSECGHEYKEIIYAGGKALVTHTLYDDSNNVVPDAVITVVKNDTNETIVLKSDKNGYFTYVFPEGSYSLTITAYGYDTVNGTLTVKNGEYEIQVSAIPKYKCSCLCHSDSFIGRLYRFIVKIFGLFGYKCCECSQTN